MGIRGEKSPFEMKKDCLLPRFDPAPRFAPKRAPAAAAEVKAPVQTDWLAPRPKAAPVPEAAPVPQAKRPAGTKAKRSWLSICTFGFLGKEGKKSTELVQAELSLEKVRVIRNDLHDSDLELVRREERPRARKASAAARSWSTAEEEQPWTKLAARLFEIERR